MVLQEYIAHHLIGTPLEQIAHRFRHLVALRQRNLHPQYKELYEEPRRIESAMARIISDSMNCIDVGAHLGSVLSAAKRLSPSGRHIAFEPVPYKYRWLKQKFPDTKILQIALSDSRGEADFFLQPQRSGFSGLRLHNPDHDSTKVERLTVKCERLDDIIPGDLPVGFIKIDVEGGELAVLRGSTSTLKRFRPTILFECTQSGLASYSLSPRDMFDFFTSYSYSLFLIKDWLANGEALTYQQFVQAMEYPFQAFNFLAAPNTI